MKPSLAVAIIGVQTVAGAGLGLIAMMAEIKRHNKALHEMASENAKEANRVMMEREAAAKDASVLYTDVWMSMGDPEAERIEKTKALSPFSVSQQLMDLTAKDSIFMHCLPAHREEEVATSVIDGPKSVIWREAYHRRTTIQALLYHLTRGELQGR